MHIPTELLIIIINKYAILCFKDRNIKELGKLRYINRCFYYITCDIIERHIIQNFIKPIIMRKVKRIRRRKNEHHFNYGDSIYEHQLPLIISDYFKRYTISIYDCARRINNNTYMVSRFAHAASNNFISNFIIHGKNITNAKLYICGKYVASSSYINATYVSFEPLKNGFYLMAIFWYDVYVQITCDELYDVSVITYLPQYRTYQLLIHSAIYYKKEVINGSTLCQLFCIADGYTRFLRYVEMR